MRTTLLACGFALAVCCSRAESNQRDLPEIPASGSTNHALRVDCAKALLKDVEALYDSIPNLSPDQQKWLDSEWARFGKMEDANVKGNTLVSLVSSKEQQLSLAKEDLGRLAKSLGIVATSKPGDPEITVWLVLATDFMDRGVFERLSRLEEKGWAVFPERTPLRMHVKGVDAATNWSVGPAQVGRQIVERIVLPNLLALEKSAASKGTAAKK